MTAPEFSFLRAFPRCALSALCLIWALVAYAPFVVLAHNPEELKDLTVAAYGAAIAPTAVAAWLLLALLLSGAEMVFHSPFPTVITFAAALGVWCDVNLFNWNYGALTGAPIDFSQHAGSGRIDMGAWLLLVGGAWIFRCRLAKSVARLAAGLLVVMLAGQISLGFDAEKGGRVWRRQTTALSSWAIAPRGNVFVIILDMLQTDIAREALALRPDLKQALRGFRFYVNTVGAGTTTVGSAPAMLGAGNLVDPNDYLQWREQNLSMTAENFLLKRLTDRGYEICQDGSIAPNTVSAAKCTSERSDANPLFLLDLGLFRALPHFLKSKIYNDQQWFLSAKIGSASLTGAASPYRVDMNTFAALPHELRIESSAKPRFFWLHFMGAHVPIQLSAACAPDVATAIPPDEKGWKLLVDSLRTTERRAAVVAQTICYLDRVAALLDRLRALNIYDESVIIILADHGDSFGNRREHFQAQRAASATQTYIPDAVLTAGTPLFAVKPMGGGGLLEERNEPATLCDVPEVILGQLGLHSDSIRECMDLINHPPNASRERHFFAYRWTPETWSIGSDNFPDVEEMAVQGDALKLESWRPTFIRHVNRNNQQPWGALDFAAPESARFLSIAGWQLLRRGAQNGAAAVAGAEARLYFGGELRAPKRLRLRISNPPGQRFVKFTVGFGGHEMCRYELGSGDANREVECTLPRRPKMDHVSLNLSGDDGSLPTLLVHEANLSDN